MLLEISYPCIGGLFVLSAQIGAVHRAKQPLLHEEVSYR